jgi:hypothetical protein
MMNDKFAAGLRQHLLDTADERPADGQLAAITALVADTPQRPPLLARLAGFPLRIRPFPSTAMRWAIVAAALLSVALGVAILGGGGGPTRSTVFEGSWTAPDPGDGSRQTLVVGAGVTPAVRYQDNLSTGGACDADSVKIFTADGTGRISGSLLEVSFPNGGGCGSKTVGIAIGVLEFDEATDTLSAEDGLTWSRVDEGSTLPTLSPATDPPLTLPAFAVSQPYACDLEAGTYGGRVGGILATVTTPTTWHGLDDVFHIEDEGCGLGGAVQLGITVVSQVYADVCHWADTGVDIRAPGAATAAFSDQTVVDAAGPTDVTLGGYPARRWDLSLPAGFNASTECPNYVVQLWRDAAAPEGQGPTMVLIDSVTVYFVEVDGLTLGVYAGHAREFATPAMLAELDAVVASLRFEP